MQSFNSFRRTAIAAAATALIFIAAPFAGAKVVKTAKNAQTQTPSSVKAPDFAYPKTVSADAEKMLTKAMASGNGTETVRALLDLALAQNSIGRDKLQPVVKRIETIRDSEKDAVTRSLLDLVLADIYYSVYTTNKYKFDTREQPVYPFPADYTEWSGQQYRLRVDSLCKAALIPAKQLQSKPIADYSNIITTDAESRIYYPTLYDFAASRSIELRSLLTPFSNVFPLLYLCPERLFVVTPKFVPSSATAADVLDTYAQWMEFHAKDVPALINIDIARIKAVSNGAYDSAADSVEIRRFEALKNLYDRYADSEYAGNILIAMTESPYAMDFTDIAPARWLYEKTGEAIKRFPAFHRLECLRNVLTRLERRQTTVSLPAHTSPGREMPMKITGVNMPSVTVDIYSLNQDLSTNTYYSFTSNNASTRRLVKSLTVNMPGSVPFVSDTTVSVTLDSQGIYVAVPRINDSEDRNRSYQKIYCSGLSLFYVRHLGTTAVVIDPLTGAPVKDATLMASVRSGRSYKWEDKGRTDKNGFLEIKEGESYQAIPVKGTDRFASPTYINGDKFYESRPDTLAMIYTALGIYHPGDTVEWAGVLYRNGKDGERVLPDMKVKATITGANGTTVGSVDGVTDAYGRVTGRMAIPKGDLTGNHSVRFEYGKNRFAGSARFMVSDYKMPTFEVKVTDTAKGTPAPGCVTLRGQAMTYSGMPVGGAEAELQLSVARNFWWRTSNAVPFYSAKATVGADGKFFFELPKELIANSPAPRGVFSARITVTSTAGENQQTVSSFTMGPSKQIIASLPENMDVSHPVRLNVKVIDGTGSDTDATVYYKLTSTEKNGFTTEGSFSTKNAVVDWKNVPGGTYSATFRLADSSEADSVTQAPIVIYRPTDKTSPSKAPVWVPADNTTVTTGANGQTSVLYGTEASETYVLYTLWSDDKVIERRWLTEKPGLHRMEIKLPSDVKKASATFSATSRFVTSQATVNFIKPEADRKLIIVTETFRDRVQPGSSETWTIRTVGRDSAGTASALIVDMYNAALDRFVVPSWHMNPRSSYRPGLQMSTPNVGGMAVSSYYMSNNFTNCIDITAPYFETYGRGFGPTLFIRGRSMMRTTEYKMALAGNVNGLAVEEIAEEKSMVTYDSAAPALGAAKMESAAVEEAEEEDAGENGETKSADFEYRMSEVPLALFNPTLTTDAEGRAELTFTVPNANTTWRFNAMAFTTDMLTASVSRSVVASKKVMVQPNLPRFMRCGDRVRIDATVMNNSESALDIKTTVEIFDPATGKIEATADTVMTVAAGASGVMGYTLTAPDSAPFMGYRVKSSADGNSDGEQALIPVLPYTTPVIETVPFYMSPDSTSMSVQLPEMKSDARVTLQFCENPAWYVVTALPGLDESEPRTSPAAAASIFSAAVADGLLRDIPAVADAIKEWTSSDRSDSTLVSMLERNADLKTVLLRATPWMMDARSDTERMERLALLFDKNRIKEVYSNCIGTLEKLRRADGGWAWTAQMDESSVWATESVLRLMGRLNSLGYMPSDSRLTKMFNPALALVEKETVKDFRKYPKWDYTHFVTLLDLWPAYAPGTQGKKIIATTVQRTLAGWKKMSVADKATAAMMLYRHGYKSTAPTVLASLRQFAEQSPSQGMWWPSVGDSYGGTMQQLAISASALEAFALIEPQSKDIDAIRQWLILQKETRNWGSSATTSDIIASFLTTSKRWIAPAAGAVLTVDGRAVTPGQVESRLGYFRTDISALNPSGAKLLVTKKSDTPAWGAVYCQFTDLMRDVKAEGCEAVTIEKRFFKQAGTQWVEATDLKVGDRVKVQLTIHANRDLEYVAITDDRAACLEPVEQMPKPIWSDGVCFYRENGDASTSMFVTRMPRGTYQLGYELWVNNAGSFASGLATLQSQYAPQISAHSAGTVITTAR